MSLHFNQETSPSFSDATLQQNLPQYYRKILREFKKTTKNFVAFNIFFILLLSVECILLGFLFPFFSHSYFLAFGLGALFLTCFSYFILLFYFQSKKPEQIRAIRNRFINSCKHLGLPYAASQHHLTIAASLLRLSAYLEDFEWQLYHLPKWLDTCLPFLKTLGAYCHWKDVLAMKQALLYGAIEQHIEQIRLTPTDLEVHASLGSAYVALSQIYLQPKPYCKTSHPRTAYYQKKQSVFEQKFCKTAKLAIEQFQILNYYAPHDPWVHEQLALGYRDLRLPQEEIREVETLLKLKPNDSEILFRLGVLYFEQGQTAKGLQVYEELKKEHCQQAEKLLSCYTHKHFLMEE